MFMFFSLKKEVANPRFPTRPVDDYKLLIANEVLLMYPQSIPK